MQYKCKVTVLEKMCLTDYQKEYLANPDVGACPFCEEGDVSMYERYACTDTVCVEGKGLPCSEAWDCLNRFIYTALQGGAIMSGWTKDERMMIACCNDGTRPVIFRLDRIDYKVLYIETEDGMICEEKLRDRLLKLEGVTEAVYRSDKGFMEVYVEHEIEDEKLIRAVEEIENHRVIKID